MVIRRSSPVKSPIAYGLSSKIASHPHHLLTDLLISPSKASPPHGPTSSPRALTANASSEVSFEASPLKDLGQRPCTSGG